MDSRGIFDAMTRNISSLHGLRSSRAGYELTLSVQQAVKVRTLMRWVNGLAMLADCLTKSGERKVFHQFLAQGQSWRLIDDPMFIAGKKMRKRELLKKMEEQETWFIAEIEKMAVANHWPWHTEKELRNKGDDLMEHVALQPNIEYPLSSSPMP